MRSPEIILSRTCEAIPASRDSLLRHFKPRMTGKFRSLPKGEA